MAMCTSKFRGGKQLLHKRVSEQSPYILSDCLKVTQKTILNHGTVSSTHHRVQSSNPPRTETYSSDIVKTVDNNNNNNNNKVNNNKSHSSEAQGRWKSLNLKEKRWAHNLSLNLNYGRTSKVDPSNSNATTPKDTPRTMYYDCPVIKVEIIKKNPSQTGSTNQVRLITPRFRSSSPSPSRRTPLLQQDQSQNEKTTTPIISLSRSKSYKTKTDNYYHYQQQNSDNNNFKRKCISIRGSMIKAKSKQGQGQDKESVSSSYYNYKTLEVKNPSTSVEVEVENHINTKQLKNIEADLESESQGGEKSATSVLRDVTYSVMKRSGRPRRSQLWRISNNNTNTNHHTQRNDIKGHTPDPREIKRSKTSTGYYPDRSESSVPVRATKSAKQQRRSTASAIPGCLPDINCRISYQRLEEFLYNDNLPKFQEHLVSFSSSEKKQLVDFKETESSANLFYRACGLRKMRFVKFMLDHCHPELELKGPYFVNDDHTQYLVTPLWQAAASGHLELVILLRENDADINVSSDTGSTPLLAACYMSHLDVVTYLISNKAEINVCNDKGLTCLMNAVHNVDIVRLLVLNGAEINRADHRGNTSMHFATEEGRLKTIKILVELGGNPLVTNHKGYNIVHFAAKYRRRDILDYLLQVAPLKVEDIIDVYEMIGAMVIIMEEDVDGGYLYLHKAATLRFMNKSNVIIKRTEQSLFSESEDIDKEFKTLQELTDISNNPTRLCLQALMICERQMGSSHEHYQNLLLYCGATFADHSNFKQAAFLWRLSYQLNFDKYVQTTDAQCDPFNPNALKSLTFVVKLLFQWMKKYSRRKQQEEDVDNNEEECSDYENDKFKISEINVRHILRMLFLHSATAWSWLNNQNQSTPCRNQTIESFHLILRSAICVLFVYAESFPRSERCDEVWQYVRYGVILNPRGERNETLLHMCLSNDTLKQLGLDISDSPIQWPSVTVINIILILGGNPMTSDNHGNTPLHHAAMLLHKQRVLSEEDVIIESLLSKGAHADQVNKYGQTAYDLSNPDDSIRHNNQIWNKSISLKCLTARVVTSYGIHYIGEVPTSLYPFIELHRSIHVD